MTAAETLVLMAAALLVGCYLGWKARGHAEREEQIIRLKSMLRPYHFRFLWKQDKEWDVSPIRHDPTNILD